MPQSVNAHTMNNLLKGASSLGSSTFKTPIGITFTTKTIKQADGSIQTVATGTDPSMPGSTYTYTMVQHPDGSASVSTNYDKNGVSQYSWSAQTSAPDASGTTHITADTKSVDSGPDGTTGTATSHTDITADKSGHMNSTVSGTTGDGTDYTIHETNSKTIPGGIDETILSSDGVNYHRTTTDLTNFDPFPNAISDVDARDAKLRVDGADAHDSPGDPASGDVVGETYLSGSENESEPDGDSDDGNFLAGGAGGPPNAPPIATDGGSGSTVSASRLAATVAAPTAPPDFTARAAVIGQAFANLYNQHVDYTWNTAPDGTVADKVTLANGTIVNYVVIDPNGLAVDNAFTKSGAIWQTSTDSIGTAGPDVAYTVQKSDAKGNAAGTVIHNSDGAEMQLVYHADQTGALALDDYALYDTKGNDLAGFARPAAMVTPDLVTSVVKDSLSYGLAQMLEFINDGYNVAAADQSAATAIKNGGLNLLAQLDATPNLTTDTTSLFNDYKNNTNPYNDISALMKDATAALLADLKTVVPSLVTWETGTKAPQIAQEFGALVAAHVMDDGLSPTRGAVPTFTWH